MLLLPKLLYYFRALPIQIPSSFYTTMQRSLSRFIWEGKKARYSAKVLIKHRKVGGMGVTDLKDYHIAAILGHPKYWFNSPEQKHWCAVEQAFVDQGELTALLLSTTLAKQTQCKQHPTIAATLQAWE